MPTYEYRCKSCERELEVVQAFTDDALTTCDECGGPLRKVFGSVGIAFKGSGFYKNDSRGSSGKSTAGTDGGSSADSAPSADKTSGSDTKTSDTKTSDTKTSDTKSSDAKSGDKPAKKSGDKAAAAATSSS